MRVKIFRKWRCRLRKIEARTKCETTRRGKSGATKPIQICNAGENWIGVGTSENGGVVVGDARDSGRAESGGVTGGRGDGSEKAEAQPERRYQDRGRQIVDRDLVSLKRFHWKNVNST